MMTNYKRYRSFRLNGQNVEFILIVAHGTINEDRLTTPPENIAVFHPSEEQYRGKLVVDTEVAPLVNTVFGERGANLSKFLNVMTGGYSPTLQYYDQMAYTTPGDDMYDYTLSRDKDELYHLMGVYNVTESLPVLDPMKFNCASKKAMKGAGCDPNRGKTGPYKRLSALEPDLDSHISSSTMMDKIKDLYPDSICFITFICCAVVAAFPTKGIKGPSAFSHHPHPRYSLPYKSGTDRERPTGSKGRISGKKLHSKNISDEDDALAAVIQDDIIEEWRKNPATYKGEIEGRYGVTIAEHGSTIIVSRPDPAHIPGNPLFQVEGYNPEASIPSVPWFSITIT